MSQALLLIDVQNDYFPEGKFPLWNTTETLHNIQNAIELAKKKNIPIIHIQHIADPAMGLAPFFNKDTSGANIHSAVLDLTPDAPIVIKSFADGFVNTNLEATLNLLGTTELFIAGMMTQNCVTHTAISKSAEKYKVTVLPDCCTTVDVMIHNIALHAVSTRVALTPSTQALA